MKTVALFFDDFSKSFVSTSGGSKNTAVLYIVRPNAIEFLDKGFWTLSHQFQKSNNSNLGVPFLMCPLAHGSRRALSINSQESQVHDGTTDFIPNCPAGSKKRFGCCLIWTMLENPYMGIWERYFINTLRVNPFQHSQTMRAVDVDLVIRL